MTPEVAYDQYYDELLHFAQKHFDRHTAEDMVQHIFTKLLECQGQVLQYRAFLYKSLVHDIARYHRDSARNAGKLRELAEIKVGSQPTFDIASYQETVATVRRIILKLPRRKQPLITDILCNGLTYQEAADRYGVTIKSAERTMDRAKKRIAAKMRKVG